MKVRSGVLHAISLAHFSLTFTRSWAANGFNARIRLKAENDQGLDNRLIEPENSIADSGGTIECRERLGGMLRYYHRQAELSVDACAARNG